MSRKIPCCELSGGVELGTEGLNRVSTPCVCSSMVKVYLYPQKYFDMWKGLNQHAVKIEKYSSNENDKIIHFKVKGLRGDYK